MACQSELVLSAARVAVPSQRYNTFISAAASCNFKFPLLKSGTPCRRSSPGALTVSDNAPFPFRFNIISGSNKRIPSIRCGIYSHLYNISLIFYLLMLQI
uniref:Uncharacterized protein n=1 Tax=Rhizophora mucronata TaxID=61149 RepID=A0A2P2J5D6_RHIMU